MTLYWDGKVATSEWMLQVAELINFKSQHPQTSGAGIKESELVYQRVPNHKHYLDSNWSCCRWILEGKVLGKGKAGYFLLWEKWQCFSVCFVLSLSVPMAVILPLPLFFPVFLSPVLCNDSFLSVSTSGSSLFTLALLQPLFLLLPLFFYSWFLDLLLQGTSSVLNEFLFTPEHLTKQVRKYCQDERKNIEDENKHYQEEWQVCRKREALQGLVKPTLVGPSQWLLADILWGLKPRHGIEECGTFSAFMVLFLIEKDEV